MYQIVHGSAGLLIGSQTGNPWLAFLLGFVSHFILDAIPHESIEIKNWQDKGNFIKKIASQAIIDLILFLGLILVLWQRDLIDFNWSILAAIAGALMPDYIWGLSDLFKIENKWIQRYKDFGEWVHSLFYKPIYIPTKYAVIIQLSFLIIFMWLYLLL